MTKLFVLSWMKLALIMFFCSGLVFSQNLTYSKPLSCHLAEGSKTLLQGSAITGSIVLSYINAILPIIAEIVVASIMRKLTTQTPEEGSNGSGGGSDGSPGTVVPVDIPLTVNSADLLAWYDRIGLSLFAAHASTSLPRVSQVFGNAFSRACPESASSPPSASTILTLGSAVVAVIAGAAYPMLNGWCKSEL